MDKKEYWKARYLRGKAERDAARPPDCVLQLLDTELAYLAGLIDGEGSFGISQDNTASRYKPVMTITMNSEPTIQWVAAKLGVTYTTVKRKDTRHNTGWRVCMAGQRLVLLTRRALPYFITKRAQAEAIVRFGDTYVAQKGNGERHPEEVFAARAAIQLQIKHLNRPHIYGPLPPGWNQALEWLDRSAATCAGSTDDLTPNPSAAGAAA